MTGVYCACCRPSCRLCNPDDWQDHQEAEELAEADEWPYTEPFELIADLSTWSVTGGSTPLPPEVAALAARAQPTRPAEPWERACPLCHAAPGVPCDLSCDLAPLPPKDARHA